MRPGLWISLLTIAAVLTAIPAAVHCVAQETGMDARITYAPDVVGVGRLFMVAVKAPVETARIAVTVPECIELLDETPLPTQSEIRKYYFRSVAPAEQAEIVFAHPEGELTVPLVIWSFEDLREFRELKGTQLPRRWPLGEMLPELKQQQLFPTGAEKLSKQGSGGWLDVPDDVLWDMQPDSTIPRWHWVNLPEGCPVHGKDIYARRAYYPWIFVKSVPPWDFKIQCPIGDEVYPSNDFANGDFTSGEFPDDGIGGGYVRDGKHYGFVAEVCQQYCRRFMTVAPACAGSYLATGDIRYVHKTLVALCRLAAEYAYLATMTHHRHRNNVGQVNRLGQDRFESGPYLRASGFNTYPIEQPGQQRAHAIAYDQIFPVIDKDPEIIPFLQSKGFTDITTHEDVRRFIEENLFAVWMQGSMDASCASNEPMSQWGFAAMAEVLDYERGDEFMDFLYYGAVFEFNPMIVFAPNTYYRDGAPFESTGGYNSAHVTGLTPIVDIIERMRARHPERYPVERFPSLAQSLRYRNIFDFCMDTVTIDRAFPQVGDGGSPPEFKKLPKIAYHDAGPSAFEHAYRYFPDPKFAWALIHGGAWTPSEDFPYTREQIAAEAAKLPDTWNDASSLHDGYGLSILRSGAGDNKRAFWTIYGRPRGHTQDDIMSFGLQAHEGVFLQHMGYPRNWGYWEYSWTSHFGARQFPYERMSATAQYCADAGIAQVTQTRAEKLDDQSGSNKAINIDPDHWQRRTLALIDIDPERFYCVDFYRISGGDEHWWPFHCQEGEFTTSGIDLTPQGGGTLAGADVEYGDEQWLAANGCSKGGYGWSGVKFPFAHLYNVEKGMTSGPYSADWKLKTGDGLGLRLTTIAPEQSELNVCDGTSPAGGNPYEMKWLMLHRAGEAPLRTQLVNIIEPYNQQAAVTKVTPIGLTGNDEAGFAAQGVVVEAGGRTDTILCATDATVTRTTENGLRFAGNFGLWAEQDGVPVAMSLIGGTELTRGGLGITLQSPEYRAKIVAVDHDAATITISPAPPAPQAMVGNSIFITNAVRRVAYTVLAAEEVDGGVSLTLNMDPLIATGQVSGADAHVVKSQTPFQLQGWRYYHGARVHNVDGKSQYQILECKSGTGAIIDPALHPEASAETLAAEFPEGSWFRVYDYGVGDEVVWPYTVSVRLVRKGVYEVTAPVDVTITLPDGSTRG